MDGRGGAKVEGATTLRLAIATCRMAHGFVDASQREWLRWHSGYVRGAVRETRWQRRVD
jgi:hypothetical protein